MILDFLLKNDAFGNITSNEKRINKSTENFNIYKIASDYEKNNRMSFVVLPTLFDAQKYYDALINLVNEDDVLFFPVDEMVAASLLISSSDFKYERINTIISLCENKPKIVVTNINGILRGNLPLNEWKQRIKVFKTGDEYSIKELRKLFVEYGYVFTNTVQSTGQFSIRGSIADYFPLNSNNPIRIDFFDTEIDTIKYFDAETQRSIMKADEAVIYPLYEVFYSEENKENMIKTLQALLPSASLKEKDVLLKDIERIDQRNDVDTLHSYIDLAGEKTSILDYYKDAQCYFINVDKMHGIINQIELETKQYYDDLDSVVLRQFSFFLEAENVLKNRNILYFDMLVDHENSVNVNAEEIHQFSGNFSLIAKEINKHIRVGYVVVLMTNKERIKRLKDFMLENYIQYKTANTISDFDKDCVNFVNEVGLSLSLPYKQLYIMAEQSLFSQGTEKIKIRYKSSFSEARTIAKFDELKPGDYVVHMSYGIGLYEGIKTMELSGRKRDYLSIAYAGNDHIYIPIEQLKHVKKYIGAEGRKPELTKLGSVAWKNTKAKVKENVEKLGAQLIELYAKRQESKGFAFGPDTEDQIEFEKDFTFEETRDQKLAIEAVKKDMESERPMDRLICGDVGFGKTEVALRASFKAVMNGKQVCYLAPTTILTRQHYHTFKDRMEKYGVEVALLNRFVSTKEKNKILDKLQKGQIDVLIGTHRLLSDDVKFKDLGLLITDEEQRFGVMHKEKIKQMKINVDSITLTATPIPRTLQMSLIGIKELSMIETPPKNRYPIQTYVTPRHNSLVKEAIEREMLRGGQVFYLYNYTEDIEEVAMSIQKMVPEAKICFAHGKMNKNDLEDIVTDFIDHKYDVMVSTTIIETGIDIPEANTLIIHDADRLGLSQLYQIRGRVGRSDKIAYAYLMYEPRKVLTPEAEKRLEAIKEFTELGSGFKIAMRDLAIRGAGDLLGEEQSGFINSVGIDLYMEILEETLKNMRGDANVKKPSTMGKSILSDRYISDDYELSEDLKIEMHKKISSIETFEDFNKIKSEFEDRFGKVVDSTLVYMYEKLFYGLCKTNNVENVETKPKLVIVTLSKERSQNVNGEFVYKTAFEMTNNFMLSYHEGKISITLKTGTYTKDGWLKVFCEYLDKIK